MGFGKRSGGEPPPVPMIDNEPVTSDSSDLLSIRTRVANHGGLDKGFIGLAAGVVIFSAGAAIAAPSLFSLLGEPTARPISAIVAGLDRDEAKLALASEAFPDQDGRSFMTLLADNFPASHERLLDSITDVARAGVDRDDLFLMVNEWGMEFALANFEYAGRTGAEGFDALLSVASDALDAVKSDAGACTLDRMMTLAEDPNNLLALSRYGSTGYKVNMRANRTLVDLAARGRKAPPSSAKLNADDENALQSVMFSFLTDPQLMNAMQGAMWNTGGNREDMQRAMAAKIDVCQIGRSLIHKLERLPSGTKSRLLAFATSGELMSMTGPLMGLQGMGAPQGLSPEMMQRIGQMR